MNNDGRRERGGELYALGGGDRDNDFPWRFNITARVQIYIAFVVAKA